MIYFILVLVALMIALAVYDRKDEAWFLQWLLIAYTAGVATAAAAHWVFG